MTFASGLGIAAFSAAFQGVWGCPPPLALALGVLFIWISEMPNLQRRVEGALGGYLMRSGTKLLMKKNGLVQKQLTLKERDLTIHYLERLPTTKSTSSTTPPTLVLFHGMTSESKNLLALVTELVKELPEWRMILPDCIGHGEDLARVRQVGGPMMFDYPTRMELGEPLHEFMTQLGVQECYAYGASLGGALVYFMQAKYPQCIKKSFLISPAMEAVMDDQFIEDYAHGRKNHFCWESREDVQKFMQDLSCPQRQVASPVPPFMLQAIWEDRKARAPAGHFRQYCDSMFHEMGTVEFLGCPEDCAPETPRYVLWPEDDYCCSHEKGKKFFAKSTNTHFHSYKDCGHLFHSDGKTVLVHAAPMMAKYFLGEEEKKNSRTQ